MKVLDFAMYLYIKIAELMLMKKSLLSYALIRAQDGLNQIAGSISSSV